MNKTLTNQWIDQQAQSLGLTVGYVKTGSLTNDIRFIFLNIRKRLLKTKTFLFRGGERGEVINHEKENETTGLRQESRISCSTTEERLENMARREGSKDCPL